MKRKRKLCVLLMALTVLLSGCRAAGTELPLSQPEAVSTAVGEAWTPETHAVEIPSFASAWERLEAMTAEVTDGDMTLYFDETTGDIALKTGDSVFFSTPWDLGENAKTVDSQKQRIASQIRLSYLDSQQTEAEIYSFPECIAKGQYTVEPLEKGFRVNMVIGRAEQRTLLPAAVPAERFEGLLEKLSQRGASRMKVFYRLFDPETTEETQLALIRDRFPVVDTQAIYVLRTVTDREKSELEGYFSSVGYTFDDMDADLKAVGADEEITVSPRFEISVQYELTDGGLSVSVPTSLISYNEEHYTLLDVGVLEYFGAAAYTDEGYLLIPDGSGAVVGFNREGDKLANDIRLPIYGYDRALTYTPGYERLMTVSLPVFGIVSDQGTLFAVVEEGAAMTELIANSGGNVSGYARVGAVLSYHNHDTFEYKDVNTQYSWTIADKAPYDGTFRICYIPLPRGSGYSEMAACYRERLALEPRVSGEGLRLVVGLYGSVKHDDEFLFIPMKRQTALTTFEDAQELAAQLLENGVGQLDLRYLGWTGAGLDDMAYTSAKIPGVLGGKSALRALERDLEEKGVGLYFDADFAYAAGSRLFDGFTATADTSRMLDKTYSGYNEVRLSSGLMNERKFKYTLRPAAMLEFYESFDRSYGSLGLKGLSVGTLGGNLNSDKSVKNGVSRSTAQRYVEEILRRASQRYDLMTAGANRYVYEYVSCLLEMPSAASGYPDADYSVPFLQMVLHGTLSYTTAPINLSGNYKTELLKAIENGSGLYFELAFENTDMLRTGGQTDLYSVDYETWRDKLLECWREADEAVGDLAAVLMVSHESLADGVSRVTYENGTKIYVNYTESDYTDGEIVVRAGSYARADKEVTK